jgi:hypothetical protein
MRQLTVGCDCAIAGAASVPAATPAAAFFRNVLRVIFLFLSGEKRDHFIRAIGAQA